MINYNEFIKYWKKNNFKEKNLSWIYLKFNLYEFEEQLRVINFYY